MNRRTLRFWNRNRDFIGQCIVIAIFTGLVILAFVREIYWATDLARVPQ